MNARITQLFRGTHFLMLLIVLSLVGQCTPAIVTSEATDMVIDFLEGEVQIIDFDYTVTRFRLVDNGSVVDVRNDIHLRLVGNPYNLPCTFRILAPMTAVTIVNGRILPTYIRKYPLKHYLALKEKYERHAPKNSSASPSERIVNKQDTDYIFGLNKADWESYALRMVHPDGWKVRLMPHDTGTSVMAFDLNTGMGLSIQPLYDSDDKPPMFLIIGSYYPLGFLPPFTDDFKRGVEKEAAADLGTAYTVSATYNKIAQFEAIELTITKKQKTPNAANAME